MSLDYFFLARLWYSCEGFSFHSEVLVFKLHLFGVLTVKQRGRRMARPNSFLHINSAPLSVEAGRIIKCFVCFVVGVFLCNGERMGLCCQLLYHLLLRSGRACHSTFLSLDIKTFDNRAATDAEEGIERRETALCTAPINYAA